MTVLKNVALDAVEFRDRVESWDQSCNPFSLDSRRAIESELYWGLLGCSKLIAHTFSYRALSYPVANV